MIFAFALIPIANVAVSLSYGGGSSPIGVILTVLLLPIFLNSRGKNISKYIAVPILVSSIALRFCGLVTLSKGALGIVLSIVLAVACIIISTVSAVNGKSVIYSFVPIFFITVLLAFYIVFVSIGKPLRESFNNANLYEYIASLICPISSAISFSRIFNCPPQKGFFGILVGVLIGSVFLIFESAGAEFGFVSVLLSVCVSALEIKACDYIISERKSE